MKNRYFLPAIVLVLGIASGAFIFVVLADTIFSRRGATPQANVENTNQDGELGAANNPDFNNAAQNNNGVPNNNALANNAPVEQPNPDGPRMAAGPTDKQLARLRRSLAGQMLQDQATGKIMTADQLSREDLIMLWEQNNPRRAVVEGMPEMPKPDETALDIMGTLGAKLGESVDGLRVTSVQKGSPAANAGMRSGDLVTKVNSRQVTTLDDVKDALERGEQGKPARVEVTRQGEFLTLNIPH